MSIWGQTDQDKAALLDPACYVYMNGENWSLTVPANTVWYALNLWNVYLRNSSRPWFHRRLHVDEALPLTPETQISAGAVDGFAYICKPELLQIPPGMTAGQLLARRQAALRTIPQFTALVDIPSGSPSGTYIGANFDTDFIYGMLNHAFTMDSSWTILVGNLDSSGDTNSANTLDEISDSHAHRSTGNILCPFQRSLGGSPGFNGIWVKQGSVSGNGIDASSSDGWGGVIYQKLPASGW